MRMGLLDEVMPQHTGRILQNSDINRNHSGILLNRWAVVAWLRVEQFAQLAEPGETPVTLFCDEPVMRI
jgi:hypothetical protein